VGNFITGFEKDDGSIQIFEHGVTIMATGGQEAVPQEYAYSESDMILTQHELEKKLEEGAINPVELEAVAMIQCVGSREEPRNYCSRVCCSTSLKHALYLKEKNPDIQVYVFYRDMMSFGFLESYYRQAREAGIIFIQYDLDRKPQVSVEDGKPAIKALDPILGRELVVPVDALVLATGIVPGDQKNLVELFDVALNQDGFYQEADYKWRPVDMIKEGIFVCGIALSPRSATESIATAEAAGQRALRILNSERIAAGNLVAQVRTSLCSRCEICLDACPYEARWYDELEDMIRLDELMCQGCGACAAVCPNSAAVLRGYKDQQIFEIIDAALEGMG
jgi:heterodisulfide reductase subunit A